MKYGIKKIFKVKKLRRFLGRFVKKKKKFSRKRIILIIILLIILIAAGSIFSFFYKLKLQDDKLEAKGLPLHDCLASSFSQELKRGEFTSFEVALNPSRDWRKYRVRMGDLPDGVMAEVNDFEGRGEGRARITLNIGDKAEKGNFSVTIVYEEMQGREYVSSYCQFNLIIR
ncbi:hypothetical protein DRH27_03125 [Candidatus Falkowbacteria bacterium]|nr:MAG: hypothetical protein DRH27_03125 [Candidatus Falkowbacteria bacterium]